MSNAPNKLNKPNKRSKLGLMVLEPRWMFDGAGAATGAHAHADAAALALIPVVPAPVEVRAANPVLDGGKLEAVFIDTSLPNYQTLEAAVKPGVAIEELASGQSGLAQMAAWAGTHSGYDSISIISPGAEAQIQIGHDSLTDAGIATPVAQAELAEIGAALKPGGEFLLYGSDVTASADGQQLVKELGAATGATVGAFSDHTDPTGIDGNWTLDSSTGAIQLQGADPTLNGGKTEVVFIDTSVADYRTLVAGVSPGIEIELIDGNQDGLAQIAQWAQSHSGYDSISILTHGAEGTLILGTDRLTDAGLSDATVQAELAVIGKVLKPGGDILLYACDVAMGADGKTFIADLAAQTHAEVAASDGLVGAANQGGSWILDDATGAFAAPAFDFSGYRYVLGSASINAGSVAISSSRTFSGSFYVTVKATSPRTTRVPPCR